VTDEGSDAGTIDCAELVTLLRDAKILDSRLTTQQVYSIFAGIQNELVVAPPKKIDHRALTAFRVKGGAGKAKHHRTQSGADSSDGSDTDASVGSLGSQGSFRGKDAMTQAGATGGGPHPYAYPEAELVYPEFLEALSAVAAFRHPNPYQSAGEKIRQFLEDEFVPWVKKQKWNG
jgi:hypothetical protein